MLGLRKLSVGAGGGGICHTRKVPWKNMQLKKKNKIYLSVSVLQENSQPFMVAHMQNQKQ